MQPTAQLFRITVIMDLLAIILSLLIDKLLALGILFYIIASRAYSYRKIRLKKYPVIGFLTVFVFQGAAIFLITYYACNAVTITVIPIIPCFVSSLLIGALYPLTQVYQHEEDKRDGVITISYLLGKRGSFVFSGILFLTAAVFLYFHFSQRGESGYFMLFLICTLPVVLFFCYWLIKVWRNAAAANFKNSLLMNIVATACTSGYFASLIFIKFL